MLVNKSTTIMLLCIVVVVKLSGPQHVCDSGWFGRDCRFQCHCLNATTCGTNGECPDKGRCSTGFFGPGCQYVDVAMRSSPDTEDYLIDEDEDTCNNNSQATAVRLSWYRGRVFSWFRLYVSNPRNLLKFTVKFNEEVECHKERKFPVSNTSVDVTCDFDPKMTVLEVIGDVAPDVCSIYVSGGRNMALRQATNQSSTFLNQTVGRAANAVDGSKDPNFTTGHCSRTENETTSAEWVLTFDQPYSIREIMVYNKLVGVDKIGNFRLQTYNDSGKITFSYSELGYSSANFFSIQVPAWPILVITIQRRRPDEFGEISLTLCEVEAFSEAECPDGYYGLSCTEQCECQIGKACFTATGACTAGCPNGKYGYNCTRSCNSKCRYGQCHQRQGMCYDCEPGYLGSYCKTACRPGTYGVNCMMECSIYCSSVCDVSFGHCECYAPYFGETCTAPISVTHLFVAVGVSALVSIVGACFFLRKIKRDEGSEADSNVTNDTLQDY